MSEPATVVTVAPMDTPLETVLTASAMTVCVAAMSKMMSTIQISGIIGP